MAKTWMGAVPSHCDVCRSRLDRDFVDGQLRMGVWGNVCLPCHGKYGVGLGVGRGQQYRIEPSGIAVQTAGGRTTGGNGVH